MEIVEETLDDLLRVAVDGVIQNGAAVVASRGHNREVCSAVLRLQNPRARLSHSLVKGKAFSPLGEFCWYMSGSGDAKQISYYVSAYEYAAEPDGMVNGAYGPRLAGNLWGNQLDTVVSLLREKPSSRRAVIQLFDRNDLAKPYKDVPCTNNLQFMIRAGRLNLTVTMRSNDVFIGMPHDVFAFTLLQEVVARRLGVELGTYSHFASSLHLYDDNLADANRFLEEGWQRKREMAMPAMPEGDPAPGMKWLLAAEAALRRGDAFDDLAGSVDPYWKDLALLLRAYRYHKDKQPERLTEIIDKLTDGVYKEFIAVKQQSRSGA